MIDSVTIMRRHVWSQIRAIRNTRDLCLTCLWKDQLQQQWQRFGTLKALCLYSKSMVKLLHYLLDWTASEYKIIGLRGMVNNT